MNYIKKLLYPSGKYHTSYGKYIRWSFVSNVIVSAESVLSTHSILSAISTNNTEIIRTTNYVGKDIIGQVGALLYISKMSQKADKDPKKFLLYSNIIQQSSYMINCITPMFPSYFLYIAGMSNIASNISFTGFGAVNARCIQILAQDDNIGEIYAKISLINTIGTSVGLISGLCITVIFPDHESRLCLIPFLGFARAYTYRRAIKDII